MREILFRGKSADNLQWLFGIPIETHIGTFISYEENPHYCGQYGYMEIDEIGKVAAETVSQYTGLQDKNGKQIFEGDILKITDDSGDTAFSDGGIGNVAWFFGMWYVDGEPQNSLYDLNNRYYMDVIGNIWDNPELLEESK